MIDIDNNKIFPNHYGWSSLCAFFFCFIAAFRFTFLLPFIIIYGHNVTKSHKNHNKCLVWLFLNISVNHFVLFLIFFFLQLNKKHSVQKYYLFASSHEYFIYKNRKFTSTIFATKKNSYFIIDLIYLIIKTNADTDLISNLCWCILNRLEMIHIPPVITSVFCTVAVLLFCTVMWKNLADVYEPFIFGYFVWIRWALIDTFLKRIECNTFTFLNA